MASFAGVDLGLVAEMNTVAMPNALQITGFCGINGVQVINHGSRGGRTPVSGALIAATPQDLESAEQQLRTLQVSATKAVLVNQNGTAFEDVRLVAFEPFGPQVWIGVQAIARRYRAEFFHQF